MISRIWHGWTTPGNAYKYEALLKEEIFVGIQNRHIRGFEGIQLLRREVGEEVEFVTIMSFDSLDAVREFAERITKWRSSRRRREHYFPTSMNVHSTMKSEPRQEGRVKTDRLPLVWHKTHCRLTFSVG